MGNRYKLNNSNNNIIKAINTDFIAFKESDKKVPLLITKNDEKAEIKVTNTMPITNIAPNFKTPSINFDENIDKIPKDLSKFIFYNSINFFDEFDISDGIIDVEYLIDVIDNYVNDFKVDINQIFNYLIVQ